MIATPAVYAECLPHEDPLSELADVGATDEELEAIGIIASNRTMVDVTSGGDCGFAHFDYCDLGLGGAGRDDTLAVLYSDASAIIQLARWRELVRPALGAGHDTVVTVVLANSLGSRGFLDLAAECRGDEACMLDRFATTPHRARRAAALAER